MAAAHAYDVIVVGLGAMGSATAAHLAERGARVLGVDRFTPPHEMGSSHGESRIIRLACFEHPLYVPLVRRAYELWRRLERDAAAPGLLRVTGGLMLGSPASGLIAGTRRAATAHGVAIEEIPGSLLRDRFPQFTPMPGFTGVFDPAAGVLDPERCVQAHLARAATHGAMLRYDEPVLQWAPAGDGVRVRTSRGTYDADKLVLAAGPWMPELLGALGPTLRVERQTVVWFDPPGDPDMWSPGRFPVYLCEFDDGQLVYGFPLQSRGWKAAVHYEGEAVTDMQKVRRSVETHDIARVRRAVTRLFPWVAAAPVRESACCFYTDTQDFRFVIDFLPGMPQVLVSSPCSGHGFKFASAIGELQAQLLLDGRCTFDVTPFRLDR